MSSTPRQSILVIDDSPDIHELVAARLRPENATLFHAFNADEAMQKACDLRPDLVLLDLDLGDVSGIELCRRMKANPETAHLSIIVLTSTMDIAAKVAAFDAGAVDYVTKPFDAVELGARARAALRTRRYQHLLATRAETDALTGLWNRAYFDERLAEEISAAERHTRPLSLVLVDVDHFKSVNDRFGHPYGDNVLQSTAKALNETVRTSDTVCRYGGEEFAVILRETAGDRAFQAAERMRIAIQEMRTFHDNVRVEVTASFGVANSCSPLYTKDRSPGALLAAADRALYQAKQEGRNCVRVV